jgi:hypothetical protein
MRLALFLCLAGIAAAQRRFFYGWDETVPNVPHDGRFTFARVRYTPAPGGRPSWVHGYPLAEQNLLRIMKEISLLDSHVDDINVVTLDDPELFKYPVAYIIEVGWRTLPAAGGSPSRETSNESFPGRGSLRCRLPIPRGLRRQRSRETADDDHQRQHRRVTVLGVVGPGPAPLRRHERSLQAGCELSSVRPDPLTGASRQPVLLEDS